MSKEHKTYRQQFEEAMACTTREEAEAWMKKEVAHAIEHFNQDDAEARYVIMSNLGYMAGYYNHEAAQKIHALFGAVHPVFGNADYHETMTGKQALDAGKAQGEAVLSELKAKS